MSTLSFDYSLCLLATGVLSAIAMIIRAVLASLKHRGDRKAALHVFNQTRSTDTLLAVIDARLGETITPPKQSKRKQRSRSQPPRWLQGNA